MEGSHECSEDLCRECCRNRFDGRGNEPKPESAAANQHRDHQINAAKRAHGGAYGYGGGYGYTGGYAYDCNPYDCGYGYGPHYVYGGYYVRPYRQYYYGW